MRVICFFNTHLFIRLIAMISESHFESRLSLLVRSCPLRFSRDIIWIVFLSENVASHRYGYIDSWTKKDQAGVPPSKRVEGSRGLTTKEGKLNEESPLQKGDSARVNFRRFRRFRVTTRKWREKVTTQWLSAQRMCCQLVALFSVRSSEIDGKR